MKFSIQTLGCKINQFDAGVLRERLVASGAEEARDGESADCHVIFTCTVTGKSDYQCRQAIRKAVRGKRDGARVIVTGCYAQTDPDAIKKIPGVDVVVGNEAKDALMELVTGRPERSRGTHLLNPPFIPPLTKGGWEDLDSSTSLGMTSKRTSLAVQATTGRSRAFLRVQEGCDAYCSYCIVPKARGVPKSAAVHDVIAEAERLIGRCYHEIVLTGVHLGAYRAGEGARLSSLVHRLLDMPGLGRLRLSSLEPMEFDEPLMEMLGNEKLCRHFHVPLQSASDPVLASMGRGYTASEYFEVINRIDKKAPGACLGADVIVGYPAEDDACFEETYNRIADSRLNYLHVFSYSPRPGTRAYEMGDPVPAGAKKERSLRLRELAKSKNLAFKKGQLGKEFTVVVEDRDGLLSGLTDNYVRVRFEGCGLKQKDAVKVRLTGADETGCEGEVV